MLTCGLGLPLVGITESHMCSKPKNYIKLFSYIVSDIPSGSIYAIYSDILSDILSCIYSDILSGILSSINSDIISDILTYVLTFSLACVRVHAWPTASGARDLEFQSIAAH